MSIQITYIYEIGQSETIQMNIQMNFEICLNINEISQSHTILPPCAPGRTR